MRILHVLDHSLPLQSGYVYRTLGIVKQQRLMGWDPILLTSGKHILPGPERERVGDWEFIRTPRSNGLAWKLPAIGQLKIVGDLNRRLNQVVREVQPEILHAHSPVLNALPTLHVGHRHKIPVVYEVRALWEDAKAFGEQSGSINIVQYAATRRLETYALRRADAVVTICRGLFDDIVGRGVANGKVTIVPNAVDQEAFAGPGVPSPQLVAKFGLEGKAVLGFFGSFYFYEGLHVLLQAVPEMRRQRPDIVVLLAGGGPEESNLRRLAEELNLGGSVVFAGRVPHETIQAYYDLAHLLVFPRLSMRLTELVTPLKPLEAMAQQRVVVASDVGGHRELIRANHTGYLFPAGEPEQLAAAVLAALDDRPSWPRIKAEALRYVETERSWARSAAHYVQVYEHAAAANRGTTGARFG